ncbi:MAG: ABC transporter permease [Micrococcales bacterium]|nr:ABC transporter permease [Micrococcales bacterium]
MSRPSEPSSSQADPNLPAIPSDGGGAVVGGAADSPEGSAAPLRRHHTLARYVVRRLLLAVLLLFGLTLVTFSLTNLVPGDPVAAALGQRAADDPAITARFRAEYGLDKSLPQQYFAYVGRLVHGNLGVSWQTHRPVARDLAQAVPATMEIAFAAILCSTLIGLALGAWAAHRRGKLADQALRVFSLIGISVPTFWTAIVCFYLFYYRLKWAPGSGRLSPGALAPPKRTGLHTLDALLAGDFATFTDAAAHLALPVMVLTLYTVGLLTRFSRSAFLEVLEQDHVRTARAKGLPARTVFTHYTLRAAAIPILTVIGLAFGSLLSGTVLVESIFGWPGLGSYAYHAASKLDLLAVMGVGLVVGVVYLTINLIVDLLYGFIDPRVRVGS